MSTRQFTRTINLTDSAGRKIPALLNCEINYRKVGAPKRLCTIQLHSKEFNITGEGSDFFKAFCDIRMILESYSLLPLCYGASRNIAVSGMCRDMGEGIYAYKVQMGQQATESIDIFSEGPDLDPVTVAEHQKFIKEWQNSLHGKPIA